MQRLTRLLLLNLLLSLILVSSAGASSVHDRDEALKEVRSYSFSEAMTNSSGRGTSSSTLGSFTADGNSPGYIVSRSYEDRPNWYQSGRTVDWRNTPVLHFVYTTQLLPGDDYTSSAQWATYNYFNPTVSPNGAFGTEVWLYTNPFDIHGLMPQLAVDTSGHAMPATFWRTVANTDDVSNCEIFWDVAGTGHWGTFLGDTLPLSLSETPYAASVALPKIELQHFGGQIITHVVAAEGPSPLTCGYWRRVGDNGTVGGWTYQRISQETYQGEGMTIAASPVNGDVAVVFMYNLGGDCDMIAYVESNDGGATWPDLTPNEIVNIDPDPEASNWLPWCNMEALYDTDGYLHIVYNAFEVKDCSPPLIDPTGLYHWTDRVSGSNAGGKLSWVAVADFGGLASMCGRSGVYEGNLAKGTISQCDTNLVIIWQQFGDPEAGDSLDCPTDNVWIGGYNADIYMSVSSTLDGSLWDIPRNLTNSHNPGCDSSTTNNCDHDNYASPARYAMNMADMGTTYWGAVPDAFQVRDALEPTYPDDGWYIDVEYVDDLYAGVVRWTDDPIWTYNPIKWFRLPCVEPVIKPDPFYPQPPFLYPADWVKAGEQTMIEDVFIRNIGNAELVISSIYADVTDGDPSWVEISSTIGTIPPGEVRYFDVILNPGGIVTTQEALVAEIITTTTHPDFPSLKVFEINTIIADTVVQVVWDTVHNLSNFALTVANQGQLGHSGWGNCNMDFIHLDSTGPDCTLDSGATEHVYLYDACPVMMIDNSEAFGTYAWNPFWIPARASDHDFRPIPGTGPSTSSGSDYMEYVSDVFVSPDSSIRFTKHTYIVDDVNFVVEGYKITADDTTDIYVGEWIDWDIPTLTDGNQGGTVNSVTGVDYVYQQGYNDPAADPPPCQNPERRFGASGLLGYWYHSEHDFDPTIRQTDLWGGHILLDDDIFVSGTDQFDHDSVWNWLTRNDMSVNNSADMDQQAFLSFGQHEVRTDDTLYIYVVHASVYDGNEDDVQDAMDSAYVWFENVIAEPCDCRCCGFYSDMPTWPENYTGNTNCSQDGKRTLSDITVLIGRVYIVKEPLCCYAAANTNGSLDYNPSTGEYECKITLSDITRLIDAVYISKNLTEPCQYVCERWGPY